MLSEGLVNFAVRQRPQSSSERGESSVFFSMASHDPSHSFTKSSQDGNVMTSQEPSHRGPRGAPRSTFLALLLVASQVAARAGDSARPGLMVVIVVDQLPASILNRLRDRFSPGGFRKLMDEG